MRILSNPPFMTDGWAAARWETILDDKNIVKDGSPNI